LRGFANVWIEIAAAEDGDFVFKVREDGKAAQLRPRALVKVLKRPLQFHKEEHILY